MRTPVLPALFVSGALVLAGCSSTAASSASDTPVAIATTTELGSVLGDITKCAGTTSGTLMPAGVDPHDYTPSNAEVAQLAKTKLVVASGLGLEGGMAKTLENVKSDGATVYEVGPDIGPIPFGEEAHADHDHAAETPAATPDAGQTPAATTTPDAHDDHGHNFTGNTEEHAEATPATTATPDEHGHGSQDPHFWMDVSKMATAAENIGAQLTKVTGDDKYTPCGKQVADSLRGTDKEVRATLDTVPAEKRILITDHEALGYFAQAYKFEIAGVVIPGGSTDAQASPAELAALAQTIREKNVPTIFANSAVSPQTVEAVAKEAGTNVKVVSLYVDSVGPQGSGAETYATMMTTNAKLIAEGLR
ncbi:metal ABC transporter substrate-binding protein [Granulicoccus phenolivorans]|uniref:metal ABC transporter substrate-binding protein n=1 Tax=Granulicoccus phenolivorans TaxID=266854 RepID=UPI00040243FD|nr:metal ABC transporter substrate-binding protein [Granulicoccus phenolivorans]